MIGRDSEIIELSLFVFFDMEQINFANPVNSPIPVKEVKLNFSLTEAGYHPNWLRNFRVDFPIHNITIHEQTPNKSSLCFTKK